MCLYTRVSLCVCACVYLEIFNYCTRLKTVYTCRFIRVRVDFYACIFVRARVCIFACAYTSPRRRLRSITIRVNAAAELAEGRRVCVGPYILYNNCSRSRVFFFRTLRTRQDILYIYIL